MEYSLSDAKFVFGRGEYCYREVLDDFANAEYINILTFNISEKNTRNMLLKKLQKAGKREIPITVVSNIPNRWPEYWGDSYKRKARTTIKTYINKLDPDRFGEEAKIFFEFRNHGKIVMTNNVIYWGSSNYSDESKMNYECGTISRDLQFIKFVNEKVFPAIISGSVSYYEDKLVQYITDINNAIAYIESVSVEIHDASYGVYEDYGTNFETVEYYDILNNYLSWRQLEKIMEITRGFEKILRGFPEQLLDDRNDEEDEDSYWEDFGKVEEFSENYVDEIEKLNYMIQNVCYDLKEMAQYNVDDETDYILSDKYGNVAYDEALNHYIDLSYNEAKERKDELVENAEESIKELLKILEMYGNMLRKLIEDIIRMSKKFSFPKINSRIDNTK